MTKFENLETKFENELNEFIRGDPDVDVILEAGMKMESACTKKVISDSSNTSWFSIRRNSGQIRQPPIHLMLKWAVLWPK